ncbi:MAG: 3-hydroxyanthranilate 3,4-dioxygenase [Planctomycetota bacterium]|nr:3-hydroxyanthranilate 3,4-dioxygenase [Planctomycetota bacterium]MDA1105863.1 3-hydroxyanthranilate 3,4-dioxygenase [Planctomycetota bacterium]
MTTTTGPSSTAGIAPATAPTANTPFAVTSTMPIKCGAMALKFNERGDATGWAADGTVAPAHNLMAWVDANRKDFKPPVGNKYLYAGQDFFVMLIVGPNARNDFHMTDSEEFFLQLKGDIFVRIRDTDGTIKDCPVREGEVFFIPGGVPHSPQRGPNTLGMVIERRRPETEKEHCMFFCEGCGHLVYDRHFHCKDIVKHFAAEMEALWLDEAARTCTKCGTRIEKPQPRTSSSLAR